MSETKDSSGETELAILKRKRGQAKSAVTRMITAANEKIRQNKPEELKSVLQSLDLALSQLQEAHRCYHTKLIDDIDREESDAYEKLILMSVHDVRHEALAWLQEEKDEADDPPYVNDELDVTTQMNLFSEPQTDMEDKNSASAELERIQTLKRKEEENFELMLRLKKEEFELELQRMRHKAELDAQMLHNQQKIQALTVDLHSTPKSAKIPTITQSSPAQLADDSISQLLEFSRQQYQAQVDSLRLPPTDMIKFDGDPLQYWKFMRLFTAMVDKESVSAEEKLTRLHQYTEGKARDAISHCLYNPNPSLGFKEALERLKSRFGNPHSISQAWVEKVLNFKEIRDNMQLRSFADQLRGCKDTLAAMKCEDELSGRRTLVEIISKLPSDLRAKWLNKNYDIAKEGRLPKLDDVVSFVETEAEKRSDPVFGGLISYKNQEKSNNFTSPTKALKKPRQNYHTNVKAAAVQENKSTRTKQPSHLRCLKCSEHHFLNQCPSFRSLTVPERLSFVKEKNLCQNCFMMGHSAQICTRNWVCNVPGCGQKHNKWLHPNLTNRQITTADQDSTDDNKTTQQTQPATSPNVTCGFAGAANGKVCLPIVPVVVRGKATNISSVTYALLDPGANTSLVSEELTKKLKVRGKPARLDLDTVGGSREGICTQSVDLEIDSLYDGNIYTLNGVRTLKKLNIGLSCLATPDEAAKWDHLMDIPIPSIKSNDVHLVIGQDAPRLLRAEKYRVGGDNDPYATRTVLGWAINGPIDYKEGRKSKAFFLKSDQILQTQVEKFWKLDDPTQEHNLSINDHKVIKLWENSLSKEGSHYVLDIPFKKETVTLPNNINLATRRLQLLERRLVKDPDLKEKYVKAMKSTIDKGYAEEVPALSLERNDGKVWYLPHHPVTHPRKPGKVRVVFDCAAKYDGLSLNDTIHQGPDLTNKLIDVLIRFRQGPVAVMADIEGMFNQIHVTPEHRDVLRFLWWKGHNPNDEVVTYRMTSHLFGGVWSPSAASFALKRCASDHAHLYDADTISTVERNFYVDDCLKSLDSPEQAIHLAAQLVDLLKQGGFRLTKWTSNSAKVLESIPAEERADQAPSLDMDGDPSLERALGLLWDTKNDIITFIVKVKEKPSTKRGLLSTISSIYDPLGFVGPFILRGKALFQTLCRLKLGWDEIIPSDIAEQWGRWLDDLPKLCRLQVTRCLRHKDFTAAPVTMQLHHFSDASELGYGAVSYLRVVSNNDINCNIVLSRNRLAPVKPSTIPRLELAAAVVAVQLDQRIRQSFELPLLDSVFWTDSTIVLHYIRNEDKRYQTFVANRVSQIREVSQVTQWKHVCTELNPADDVSRGLSAEELINSKRWLKGPAFLWQEEQLWPCQPELGSLPPDAEVKKSSQTYAMSSKLTNQSAIDCFIQRYSSWYKLKRAIALILRVKNILRKKTELRLCSPITLNEMKQGEIAIINYVQRTQVTFPKKEESLRKLNPVRLGDGLLCVGGRLTNAPIPEAAKHPAILPQKNHVSKLVIWHFHKLTGHSGVERVLAEIRQSFWIISGRAAVKQVLAQCVPCKRQRAPISTQYMANLPVDRVTPCQPPFTHVGIDYFGPINVKRGRSEVKRYGCLFTCLTIRAIHLEVAHSLDTESFINALQRFMARRGTPQLIRSDNGTNFIGARHELQKALNEWNQQRIEEHLLQRETQWKFNPPAASHMGGVWERQIRSVRSILMSLAGQQILDDEGLTTLFCIIENIVNGRTLTKVSEDPRDSQPLTPNDLLLLRPECPLPPGHFVKQDLYRRRWRQVQYLADIFWVRWVKEYLPNLQQRQKWNHHSRNYQIGDLVLILHESTPRCQWPLGLVTDVNIGDDGLVRSVQVKTHRGTYIRPIHKLCLLEGNMDE
ncbi:uncharacterized protein LOC119776626 [Cyprinodon tularosa]|uniref:uncharacterized protein LOC119776626 n=1 Tax=Cyprinodon tularosa TaxID=77115 RepID=UPI0018E24160|nr:uncharacterized protein LOC119776626 [Cyprinodon tularosa]